MEDDALTVNKLGKNRVLIVLCEQDITDNALGKEGIDFNNGAARSRVIWLTRRACRSSGIDTGGKRVNIEALPLEKTCYLLVTVGALKRYRLKNSGGGCCFCIGGSTAFLNAVEQLYRRNLCCRNNSAYKLNNDYFLVFDYPLLPESLSNILLEYGRKLSGKFAAARIKETAKPICTRNAIESIGKHLV